jgi:hypothetical protein
MPKFFRQEKKQPFTYPVIETRSNKSNYSGWIVGGIILLLAIAGGYFFLK